MEPYFSSTDTAEDENFEKRRREERKMRRQRKKCSQVKCRLHQDLPKMITEALSELTDLKIQLEAVFMLQEAGKIIVNSIDSTCKTCK
jgi:hypothetical protein